MKKIVKKCILLVVTFTMLFATTKAQNGTLKGTVKDEKGNALAAATVIAIPSKKATKTDASGSYELNLPIGTYIITASYAGTESVPKSVTVTATDNSNLDFTLLTESNLQSVVVIGSRSTKRVSTETAVPVDILNIADLSRTAPQSNLNQILNFVAPSFTSNTSTVADGTDHLDPAQLRGLGPDQVLVLMNGKRRHTSSLVNVNGTPGRSH